MLHHCLKHCGSVGVRHYKILEVTQMSIGTVVGGVVHWVQGAVLGVAGQPDWQPRSFHASPISVACWEKREDPRCE